MVFVDCFTKYYMFKTNTFSEFLISIKPYVAVMKKIGNEAYYNSLQSQYGKWPANIVYYMLSGNDAKVCTKLDWGCLGSEYLFVKGNANLFFLSRASLSFKIAENYLDVSLSAYSIRALSDMATGSGRVSELKKSVLLEIQNLKRIKLLRFLMAFQIKLRE